MQIDLAIVPVAGQGTRLLPSTKSQPKEMLPVGRKPVVQYVVEELALSGVRRLLFVTGPGKTSIENHFDLNAELIAFLRETGKEELLEELDFERQQLQYFYTRQRRQLGSGSRRTLRPAAGRQPAVRRRPGRLDHRSERPVEHRPAHGRGVRPLRSGRSHRL